MCEMCEKEKEKERKKVETLGWVESETIEGNFCHIKEYQIEKVCFTKIVGFYNWVVVSISRSNPFMSGHRNNFFFLFYFFKRQCCSNFEFSCFLFISFSERKKAKLVVVVKGCQQLWMKVGLVNSSRTQVKLCGGIEYDGIKWSGVEWSKDEKQLSVVEVWETRHDIALIILDVNLFFWVIYILFRLVGLYRSWHPPKTTFLLNKNESSEQHLSFVGKIKNIIQK